jgi:predicted house-cleaning noncanonical NTP pyrophosphatase (MazG superfamily)
MVVYNKLVRDEIPGIIEASGKSATTRVLNKEDFQRAVLTKFGEELEEYEEADSNEQKLEELADILELVNTLAHHENSTLEKIEKIRQEKAAKRGGFQKQFFLEEVE